MLARIQTLYLLLASLLASASMFFPFWSFSSDQIFIISDFGAARIADVTYTIACFAGTAFSPLTAVLSLAAVFLYKNRTLQTTLILGAIALFALDLFSGLAASHFMNRHFLAAGTIVTHAPGAGLYIMLPEPLLLFLGLKGVKKDEKIATAYKRL
ncbi:MAG: DUF4293 domain-containing protein [Chlorobiaceae bacterium]|nr:DUF4293 domain-containing protein [Chlorobiaceae bacterium]NTV60009.1 DUF4293 domain-containing protein [Chlorobiaceae bacterium]